MKFLLMIIDDEHVQAEFSDAEMKQLINDVRTIENDLVSRGKFIDSRALRPSRDARTVRMRAGDPVVFDGPFAAAREVIGGYFLVDCETIEEAVGWARKFPLRGIAAIEVRPVWEMS